MPKSSFESEGREFNHLAGDSLNSKNRGSIDQSLPVVKESKKRVALLPLRKKLSFSLVGSPWLNDSPASSGLGVEDLRFQDSPSGLGEEDPQ